MGTQHIETIVIGGGQSGLATGYHLKKLGRKFLILDALGRPGDNWRRHYDSLKLYSPARIDGLPDLPFPGPAMALPGKDEVADYLEAYAAHHELPVRSGTHVTRVARDGDGFVVETTSDTFVTSNVVVATGTYGKPWTPPIADQLDASIVQLHSSDYKNPSQLQPGPVLVVGAAHSGADVALEVAATHVTYLSGRNTGEMPFTLEGPVVRFLSPVLRFATRKVVNLSTPIGRRAQSEIRAHGGPLLRVREKDLTGAGVRWLQERTEAVVGGLPQLAGGRVLDVRNVVWCTGFRHDFGWIDLPIMGDDGWPLERRGVVESQPGLYFMGLAFQYAFASMLILGAGQDAQYVARHLDARMHSLAASAVTVEQLGGHVRL